MMSSDKQGAKVVVMILGTSLAVINDQPCIKRSMIQPAQREMFKLERKLNLCSKGSV
jgi:hypothetical protein